MDHEGVADGAGGSPVESCNMPDASIATWPRGSLTTRKITAASAGIIRWTSNRSLMRGLLLGWIAWNIRRGRKPGSLHEKGGDGTTAREGTADFRDELP